MTKKVNRIIEVIMAALIVCMVGANFWQIFTRFVLNHAADWTEEFMRYALIWLTMLGVPYAYGKKQHIAIEFLLIHLRKRAKRSMLSLLKSSFWCSAFRFSSLEASW